MKSFSFEQGNQNTQFLGVQLETIVENKDPRFMVPGSKVLLSFPGEMGEITCKIDEQPGRGQKTIISWLVLAHYLFFVIVKVLD